MHEALADQVLAKEQLGHFSLLWVDRLKSHVAVLQAIRNLTQALEAMYAIAGVLSFEQTLPSSNLSLTPKVIPSTTNKENQQLKVSVEVSRKCKGESEAILLFFQEKRLIF